MILPELACELREVAARPHGPRRFGRRLLASAGAALALLLVAAPPSVALHRIDPAGWRG